MSLTQKDFDNLYLMQHLFKNKMVSREYVEQQLGIAPTKVKLWLRR